MASYFQVFLPPCQKRRIVFDFLANADDISEAKKNSLLMNHRISRRSPNNLRQARQHGLIMLFFGVVIISTKRVLNEYQE
jgi:hypothetical protein